MRERGPGQEDAEFKAPDSNEEKQEQDNERPRQFSRRWMLKHFMAASALTLTGRMLGKEAVKYMEGGKEDQLQQDWQEYKATMETSTVRRDIAEIEKQFGDRGRSLVFKAKEMLRLFDQLAEAERSGIDLINDEQQRNLLEGAVEEYRMYFNEGMIAKSAKEHLAANAKTGLTVTGFEKIPGMDNDKLRQILDQNTDGGYWVNGNISGFEYVDREQSRRTFKVAGEAHGEGLSGMFSKSGAERVLIFKGGEGSNEEQFRDVLSHEIAHHHDWENSNALTLPERMQFLLEVSGRVGQRDSFHSPYVEADIPEEFKDEGPEFVRYWQAREYWAVLGERFDNHAESLGTNKPEEYALYAKWKNKILSRYK